MRSCVDSVVVQHQVNQTATWDSDGYRAHVHYIYKNE